MIDYIYDGTFEGLLTCVYHHYYTDQAAGIYTAGEYQPTLLWGCREVESDSAMATAVYEAIEKKISSYDLKRVYKAYLSSEADKEMKILRYLVLGFRIGARISSLHGDPVVFDMQSIEKRMSVEKERMLQFVRFSVMKGGVLYAEIEPDNDMLELIADHFCDRYREEPFVIHDIRRHKALTAYRGEWYISPFDGKEVPDLSDDEKLCRELWREYFERIAIRARKNRRCQQHFIPSRYGRHLTEMNGR